MVTIAYHDDFTEKVRKLDTSIKKKIKTQIKKMMVSIQ